MSYQLFFYSQPIQLQYSDYKFEGLKGIKGEEKTA